MSIFEQWFDPFMKLWIDYFIFWICVYLGCNYLVKQLAPSQDIHRYTGLLLDTAHAVLQYVTFDISIPHDFNSQHGRDLLERFTALHLTYHALFCPLSYYHKKPKGWDLVGFAIFALSVFMSLLSFF